MSETLLISACLLGVPCRYDGTGKTVESLPKERWVPVCPETLAGLGIPRPPMEMSPAGRVHILATGHDITPVLQDACDQIVQQAQRLDIRRAILKRRSPSCGSATLWQNGHLVPGEGLLTKALRAAGIAVEGEPQ